MGNTFTVTGDIPWVQEFGGYKALTLTKFSDLKARTLTDEQITEAIAGTDRILRQLRESRTVQKVDDLTAQLPDGTPLSQTPDSIEWAEKLNGQITATAKETNRG